MDWLWGRLYGYERREWGCLDSLTIVDFIDVDAVGSSIYLKNKYIEVIDFEPYIPISTNPSKWLDESSDEFE